jgi:hypothetical protein
MGTQNAKRGRVRMASAGLLLFLVITAGDSGRTSRSSSDDAELVGVISTLARFPVVLRTIIMAAISGKPDEKVVGR